MNALTWFLNIHEVCHFQTKEGNLTGRASNSEIRRWFKMKAIVVNGKSVDWNDSILKEQINSIVLFPSSKKRKVTLL